MKEGLRDFLIYGGIFLFIMVISFAGSVLIQETVENYRGYKCFRETADLWNSVNDGYPDEMDTQQAYDKVNREACASMKYLSCVRGIDMSCPKTFEEKQEVTPEPKEVEETLKEPSVSDQDFGVPVSLKIYEMVGSK